jgi:hypothetical protein
MATRTVLKFSSLHINTGSVLTVVVRLVDSEKVLDVLAPCAGLPAARWLAGSDVSACALAVAASCARPLASPPEMASEAVNPPPVEPEPQVATPVPDRACYPSHTHPAHTCLPSSLAWQLLSRADTQAPAAVALPAEEPPSTTDRKLRIVIAAHQKAGEGLKAHHRWQVSSTDLDTSRHCRVSRRYSDFVHLKQQLVEAAPGAIVPPLPGKNLLLGKLGAQGPAEGALSGELEGRRRGLEAFLQAVQAHALLRVATVFALFLEAEDREWGGARARSTCAHTAG